MLAEGNISGEDLDRFTLVDNVEETVDFIDNFYSVSGFSPNF
jgi:hypothetical protein